MSYADLYTLAGKVAIEAAGGPTIAWRAGRKDAMTPDAVTPDGRLPGADKGSPADTAKHLRMEVFYRMGCELNQKALKPHTGSLACYPRVSPNLRSTNAAQSTTRRSSRSRARTRSAAATRMRAATRARGRRRPRS